jgi:hypothetical protein
MDRVEKHESMSGSILLRSGGAGGARPKGRERREAQSTEIGPACERGSIPAHSRLDK